jgi:hypothetical protein
LGGRRDGRDALGDGAKTASFLLKPSAILPICNPMEISAVALQGLNQAQAQVEQAGVWLASMAANTGEGPPVDTADLSEAARSLLSAKNAFAVNIKLLKVADEMQSQVLNLLA